VITAALLVAARPSRAEDMGPNPLGAREGLTIAPRIGVESSWTSFDLQGTRGEAWGIAGRIDLKLSRVVGVRVIAPVYVLRLDGQGAQVGPGDAELRARFMLYDANDWRVFVGVLDQLPTGASSLGMGQQANQVTAFATAGWKTGPLVVYGIAGDTVALRTQDRPAPVDYVDPGTDHELRYTVGGIYAFDDAAYLAAAIDGTTVLVPSAAGDTLFTGGIAAGLLPGRRWKVVASARVPLAGEHRFESKLGLDAYVFF
jgi:hypothetical protein